MTSFVVVHLSAAGIPTDGNVDVRSHFPGTCLQLGPIWVVDSEEMADEIRDKLSAILDDDQAVVVFGIGDQAAWKGLPSEYGDWLADHV